MRNLLEHIAGLPRNLIVQLITRLRSAELRWASAPIIWLINIYQKTLSPDHGPFKHLYPYGYCRHSPTCSEYAKKVITERGVIIGLPKAIWRVLTCNPFTKPSSERILEVAAKR